MVDENKPDLLIHSLYIEAFKNYDMANYFNLITVNDLKLETQKIDEVFTITDDYVASIDLTLRPFYTQTRVSGNDAAATSYDLQQPTKIYKINRNLPRYIIWTKIDPLFVCGTIIDRVESWELFQAFVRAKNWSYTINQYKSIAVFDLDKTLITDNCEKILESERLLAYAKHEYDILVLWSHASALHVDEQLEQFNIGNLHSHDIFDLVIKGSDVKSPKNLLHIYNYIPYTKFTRSVLIDDLVSNWTPEYDKFLIPYKNTTLKQALYLI